MYAADTIAAIATAPGPGAIGIIRVSGPEARAVAAAVTGTEAEWPSHKLVRVRLRDRAGAQIDDGLAVLMRGPHSYTGEDVVEIQCHGSPEGLQAILRAVLAAGARAAEPGEFTKRAFLNGKLDLAQAEAVMDLVRCRTPAAAAQAADQLAGALSRHLGDLRQRLIQLKAHLEVQIDFSEEDVDLDPQQTTRMAAAIQSDVAALLATYERGRIYNSGLRIAIVGRPNVGKSSLLNALARANRAIVTEIPGTTRDVVEEVIDLGGVPVVVRDTAGLREAADRVEEIGIERAREAAGSADLALVVLDRSQPYQAPPLWPHAEQSGLLVVNKTDLPPAWSAGEIEVEGTEATIEISARTGEGLAELEEAIARIAGVAWSDSTPPLTNTRQRDAMTRVKNSLEHAVGAANTDQPPDIIAVDVQLALDHLAEITGEIVNDDILDVVFREFCMGK